MSYDIILSVEPRYVLGMASNKDNILPKQNNPERTAFKCRESIKAVNTGCIGGCGFPTVQTYAHIKD